MFTGHTLLYQAWCWLCNLEALKSHEGKGQNALRKGILLVLPSLSYSSPILSYTGTGPLRLASMNSHVSKALKFYLFLKFLTKAMSKIDQYLPEVPQIKKQWKPNKFGPRWRLKDALKIIHFLKSLEDCFYFPHISP